jgi:RND family efflux transporter MFP subunit
MPDKRFFARVGITSVLFTNDKTLKFYRWEYKIGFNPVLVRRWKLIEMTPKNNHKMSKFACKLSGAILLFFSLLIVCSCKTKPKETFEELARRSVQKSEVIVKTVKLEPSTFYKELVSNGRVTSAVRAQVPFKVTGMIKDILVSNGTTVSAGQLLAVIDDFEYAIRLEKARQAVETAKIAFRDDMLSMYATDDTTRLSPDKVKTARIRSGIIDAATDLRLAEYNYNNTRITAPVGGRIASLDAKKWNPAENYKSLCTIIADETMDTEFPVTESEYAFIENGMPVNIIPFFSDSLNITGYITQINPLVNDNGQIVVKARFNNTAGLVDGMNVKVLIRKPVLNRLVVPKEALVIRQGRDVIFVREDSLAIWKYVTVEYENSRTVSVKEGLKPGDLVIVSGNVNLAHETKVREE